MNLEKTGNNKKRGLYAGRDITDYNIAFEMGKPNKENCLYPDQIEEIAKNILNKKTSFRYTDLCCGVGYALRSLKKYLLGEGFFKGLFFQGVDIHTIDDNEIQKYLFDEDEDIPEDKYSFHFVHSNVEDFKYQEKQDLITCCNGLKDIENPLKLIRNSLNNLNIGGFFCINELNHIPNKKLLEYSLKYMEDYTIYKGKTTVIFEKISDGNSEYILCSGDQKV
ncbi:MAG: methyltransferase domain-containing protein [Candidatus Aenigmarchaeota archaeon]|nr:methyltransferase domain-containing protein [Candidatus Aenigmarchaeota archaeon]MCK5289909.1 methyltransferase domain-containing protein [Candidatus Aenigmarchaeota archaeon]MCK5373343.1 methyltransferase domain-containing protein [Candidatus Aenigmarchaeota archaeon]